MRTARAAGIRSVSIDLLTDIPGQTIARGMPRSMQVLDLGPDHLSAYLLTLEDPEADGLAGADGRPPARSPGCASLAGRGDDGAG